MCVDRVMRLNGIADIRVNKLSAELINIGELEEQRVGFLVIVYMAEAHTTISSPPSI